MHACVYVCVGVHACVCVCAGGKENKCVCIHKRLISGLIKAWVWADQGLPEKRPKSLSSHSGFLGDDSGKIHEEGAVHLVCSGTPDL